MTPLLARPLRRAEYKIGDTDLKIDDTKVNPVVLEQMSIHLQPQFIRISTGQANELRQILNSYFKDE